KLMKSEELSTIKGGYGEEGWAYCMQNGSPCGNWPVGDCGLTALEFCDRACPGWTSIACFPW
ncbi:MAG: hypothetical protein ACM3RX_09545, partial [Methanococcaceae archaeon]